MNEHRIELVTLLAELDQQLAEAEDTFAEVTITAADATLETEFIDGLRAALENVEMQLERELQSNKTRV